MPLVKITCSSEIPPELLPEFSAALQESIGKPEKYIMVVADKADLLMSGAHGPAAFVEVKSVGGLSREVNGELSTKICDLLQTHLNIPGERIYIVFQSISGDHWGWNGSTFG